jgi:outer membrane protein TolC
MMHGLILPLIFVLLPWPVNAQDMGHTGPVEIHLGLDDAVAAGIKNSYDLRMNGVEQTLAKKALAENFRNFLPVLSIDYANSLNVVPYAPDTRLHNIKFNLSQPVYQGGRIYAAWKAGQADLKLKQAGHFVLENNIRANIQKQYFTVIIQEKIAEINQKLSDQSEIQRKLAGVENRLGTMTAVDLAEMEAYAENSRLEQIKAENLLSEEKDSLKKTLYLDWKSALVIDDDIAKNFICSPLHTGVDELVSLALSRRTELQSSRVQLVKARYNYNANKYSWLPGIALNFEYGLSGPTFFPFKPDWSLGVQFDIGLNGVSLSSAGNTGAGVNDGSSSMSSSSSLSPFSDISWQRKILQSESDLKSAEMNIDKLVQETAMDVSRLVSRLNESWRMKSILSNREAVLDKRQRIYFMKLDLGEAKRVDCMKAETEYYQARVETVKGILEYITSAVDLELACGLEIGGLDIIRKR